MSLYSPFQQTSSAINGIGNMTDGSGTINPAALNSSGLPQTTIEPSSRGLKRSRSPDHEYGEYLRGDDDDESKPRKRGRPPKTPRTSGDFNNHAESMPMSANQASPEILQTPQAKSQVPSSQSIVTPTQSSPPRTTPQKSTVKALPTVRDHTSDQLGPEGDEYVAREYDEAGEKKVDNLGFLKGGREYKIKAFPLPGRGEKLFMLATECARCLQYRDSYLLFNKNRSLFKIIASIKEKEEMVAHDVLPYSYRSRQIAIVTARSMFRQFGSRVIKDGRRVRDDYWEAKAIKQGFTEQDMAGEKRPGAARAREAAAADQAHARQMTAVYGDVVYSNGPNFGTIQPPILPPGMGSTLTALPSFDMAYDSKYRDIPRPRQELTGLPYSDLTRPSSDIDMVGQAGHAAEYSKTINQQGQYRRGLVQDYWHRPHDPPVSTPPAQDVEPATSSNREHQFSSPRFPNTGVGTNSSGALAHQPQTSAPSMNPPNFPLHQNPVQSPVRQSTGQQNFSRESAQFTPGHPQFSRSSSNLSISQSASQPQSLPYGAGGYSPHGMTVQQQQNWGGPPPQPHQSPGLHRMQTPRFSPSIAQGQIPSPVPGGHASQSPHPQQMQPPHMPMMHHQGSSGQMAGQQLYGPGAGLQAMGAGGFAGMQMGQRAMYGMGAPTQFMPQAGQQHGQGWPGQQNQGSGAQWGQGYQ